MSSGPLFTIVVAVRNARDTVQHCISSVVAQTFQSKELIVIDGASTDGTLDIVKALSPAMAYWLSEPDTGIYQAWNRALTRARGEWVWFLGADDFLLHAGVLAEVAPLLQAVPARVRVVYGRVRYVTRKGEYLYTQGEPWEIAGRRYRQIMSIPHQGVLHRRSLFEKHGSFDERFQIAGDYELLLRELKNSAAGFLPMDLAGMRQGGLSSAAASSRVIVRELRLAQRKNGLRWPGPLWVLAMLRVYLRMLIWRVLSARNARRLLDCGRYLMGRKPHWTKNVD